MNNVSGLRKLRELFGWGLEQVAHRSGIAMAVVKALEAGEHPLTRDLAVKLRHAYSLDEINETSTCSVLSIDDDDIPDLIATLALDKAVWGLHAMLQIQTSAGPITLIFNDSLSLVTRSAYEVGYFWVDPAVYFVSRTPGRLYTIAIWLDSKDATDWPSTLGRYLYGRAFNRNTPAECLADF